MNSVGQRGNPANRVDSERQMFAEKGLAAIALAIDDVNAAIMFMKSNADVAQLPAPANAKVEFAVPPEDDGRNPSMEISLNNLRIAFESLGRTRGGEMGGFRAKISSDIIAAANNIIVANHAVRDPGRGRGNGTPARGRGGEAAGGAQ
jgi:hypothetical protein